MTRFAWLTPGYPPDRGGVSDHSYAMVNELRAGGHDVLVCSKPQERGFSHLTAELETFRPDAVVVAYTPLAFAPRTGGISAAFTFWCMRMGRRLDASTLLLAHEASLPVGFHLQRHEIKLAMLGAAQILQFEILMRTFDSVVFSHEGNRDIWVKRVPRLRGRLHTVRICSSVPFVRSADPRAELAASGYSLPARAILFFGTGHDSVLFDYVEAAIIALLKFDPEVQLIIIGMDAAKLRRARPSLADLGSAVQTLGFVPAREVSLWLQVAEMLLAPLIEGVNARKTTVMAAFQHGLAVITTRGFHTRADIEWGSICTLAPLERRAFAALAVRCFQDPSLRASLGTAAKAEYEAHASPSVTAAQLFAQAVSSRRP
jgi:glycosyltransferase involved in cell wall biosynthesis